MEDNKELSNEQFGAIRRSIKLGRTLQEDHPEIAVIYEYYSQRDIPKMLDIQSKYGVGDNVALSGVFYSINGHEEGFGVESYVGLITDEEELKRLMEGSKVAGSLKGYENGLANRTTEQMSEDSQKGGRKVYEQGIGIHAQTLEEKREIGLKSGQKTYEQGLGIFGRTAEQMSEDGLKGYVSGLANRTAEQHMEDSQKGGHKAFEQGLGVHGRTAEQHSEDSRNAIIAQGKTPWIMKGDKLREDLYCAIDEVKFAYMLSQEQEYQHPKGGHAGKTNNELVAFALNMKYHDCKEVRNINAVNVQLYKYRKSLVDVVA